MQQIVRRLLGRSAPQDLTPLHYPEAHAVSASLMVEAAELDRLKNTPAYRRIEAEAALREYEQARQEWRRVDGG